MALITGHSLDFNVAVICSSIVIQVQFGSLEGLSGVTGFDGNALRSPALSANSQALCGLQKLNGGVFRAFGFVSAHWGRLS